MLRQRPFLIEILTVMGLAAAPFVLPYLDFSPNTVNRILVWGLFGLGVHVSSSAMQEPTSSILALRAFKRCIGQLK